MARLILDDYPWGRIEQTKRFITDLYQGPPPQRPAVIMHFPPPPDLPPAPAELNEFERNLWTSVQALRRRPVGPDDFVPMIGTGAGTSAMATAFGCPETEAGGVRWVSQVITEASQIDHLQKPALTAGRLGWVLAQTRAYAAQVDQRIAIKVMDFQSPFTTCEQILGSDLFFVMPYDEPTRLHALMDLVTNFAIEFFQEQMRAAGPNCCPGVWPGFWFPKCAGIMMSDDNLVNVSPAVYDEFVVPYNNRVSAAFGGLFLHSCTIKECNLPSLHKLKGLTGINCDISTSVSTARLLEEFGENAVVAPHAYINTNTNFANYREFMVNVLSGWRPGLRLFIHPCSVMYIPSESREILFNQAEVEAALAGGEARAGAYRDQH